MMRSSKTAGIDFNSASLLFPPASVQWP